MDHVHNEPEPRVISSASGQPAELRRVERKIRIHRQPKTLITGVGAVEQLGIEAKKLNGTKVLVITDQGVSECGMCVDVERPLLEAGLEVDFYDKAVPEPPMSTIEEIVRIVEKGGYDLIVGFGGGSADRRRQGGGGASEHRRHRVRLRRHRPGQEEGPADHRRPHHRRHRLRVHGHRHLRQREAQREAGPREPVPHAECRARSTRRSRSAARPTSPRRRAWTRSSTTSRPTSRSTPPCTRTRSRMRASS